MQNKTLLVVGDDKIGRKLLQQLKPDENLVIYLDQSNSPKRVIKLVKRGSLSLVLLFKMFWANLLRKGYPATNHPGIQKNADMRTVIESIEGLETVYLFRAGLIINKKTLAAFPRIFNIHCGRLPEYGGLGIIQRALDNAAYDQCATLYQVTVSIDDGEVSDTEPYLLDPKSSYRKNEDNAYEAGIKLVLRTLGQ